MYQQLFETLFVQCSQALLRCDARGRIMATNEAAGTLLGVATEVLVGDTLEHLFATDDPSLPMYLTSTSEHWQGHVRYRGVRLSLMLTRVRDDAGDDVGETVLAALEPAFKQLPELPLLVEPNYVTAKVFGDKVFGDDTAKSKAEDDETLTFEPLAEIFETGIVKTENRHLTSVQTLLETQTMPTFEPLSVMVLHVDKQWRVTYLNEAATKASKNTARFAPEAVIGRSLWQVLPHLTEADNPIGQAFRYAMTTGEPVYVEAEPRDPDLAGQWHCNYAIPTGNGLLVHGLDNSERKRTEEAIARALQEREVMFNSIADYVLVLDQHWRFVYANDAAQQLYPQGFIGKSYFDVFATGMLFEKKYRQAFKTKRPVYFEAQSPLDGAWVEMRVFPSGDNLIIYGVDISERKRLEQQLEQALADKETILNSITDSFVVIDSDWRFVYANTRALQQTPDILGKHYFAVFPEQQGMMFEHEFHEALATKEPRQFEAFLPKRQRWVEMRIYPWREGIALFKSNIDGRKQLEYALAKAIADKENVLNSITDSVVVLDHDWRFVYANNKALRSNPDLVNKYYWDVFPHNRGTQFERCYQQVFDTGKPVRFTTKMTATDTWAEVRVFPSPDGIAIYVANISELKEKEAALEHALATKELLIKEVHHRTKNNMQLISSMLSIQIHSLKDEDSRQAVADSRDRINVLADVHRLMYQQLDSETVNTEVHLRGLLQKLARSMTKRAITVDTDITAFEVTIHQAIPLGLIVNELFTNALKHAFREPSADDVITVRLWLEADEQVVLEVADNGVGLSVDFDANQDTLGMTIIQSLVGQLDGAWSLTNGDAVGSVARVRFPKGKLAKENGQLLD